MAWLQILLCDSNELEKSYAADVGLTCCKWFNANGTSIIRNDEFRTTDPRLQMMTNSVLVEAMAKEKGWQQRANFHWFCPNCFKGVLTYCQRELGILEKEDGDAQDRSSRQREITRVLNSMAANPRVRRYRARRGKTDPRHGTVHQGSQLSGVGTEEADRELDPVGACAEG